MKYDELSNKFQRFVHVWLMKCIQNAYVCSKNCIKQALDLLFEKDVKLNIGIEISFWRYDIMKSN